MITPSSPPPPPPKLSCVRNGTDDACFASAIQWKKRRAKEEMGAVRGPSATRSWGKCSQHTVWFGPVVVALLQLCAAFNLDTEERVVFTGPRGSYFGYSVEFFSNSSRWSLHASSQSLLFSLSLASQWEEVVNILYTSKYHQNIVSHWLINIFDLFPGIL